jgi:hypothetical protein
MLIIVQTFDIFSAFGRIGFRNSKKIERFELQDSEYADSITAPNYRKRPAMSTYYD